VNPAGVARIEGGHNVGVQQSRRGTHFGIKTIDGAGLLHPLRRQRLECHDSLHLFVFCQVNTPHAAAADQTLDTVFTDARRYFTG